MKHDVLKESSTSEVSPNQVDCMFSVYDDVGVSRGHLRRGLDRSTLIKLFAGSWADVPESKIEEFMQYARQVQIDVVIESSKS